MVCAACAMMFSLQSCEDEIVANDLEGTWRGNLRMHMEYGGVEYTATYSQISFDRSPVQFTSGRGYWLDYYGASYGWGRNYVANHIEWNVRDRIIYVYFVEEDYSVEIREYRLTDYEFTGWLTDGYDTYSFRLYKIDDPDWDSYYYGYDYYTRGRDGSVATKPKRFLRKDAED